MNKSYIIIGLMALLMSCNTSDDTDEKTETKTTEKEEHTSKKETSAISFNDGKKWKVNEEMLPHIEKSEAVFNNFEGEDYDQLSEDMMKHTNNLIQSCTMKGASHDELHKWLHPHLELLKSLNSENPQKAKDEIIPAIEKSFTTFHKYFK